MSDRSKMARSLRRLFSLENLLACALLLLLLAGALGASQLLTTA